MSIAPANVFPERAPQGYEVKGGGNPTRRGPLRFEEGVATDTDVPNEFGKGVASGQAVAPGRPNRNAPVWRKPAEETMAERAHVGSAAWVEAPTMLSEFAAGSFADYGQATIETVYVGEAPKRRPNATVVND
jgi:hypothetical protein